MKEYLKQLENCSLFYNIDINNFQGLLSCINAYKKSYKSNEIIFMTGDVVSYVCIVLKGSVDIIKETTFGENHILAFLGESNVFAEGIVCTKERISPVTVKTKVECDILFIPFEKIIRTCCNLCDFHTQLISNMMMLLGQKNNDLNKKIDLLTIKSMRKKICAYLLKEYQNNNSLTFSIIPNRNELAEFLNVSRPSMSRELSKMKDLGLIDYYQNTFRIIDLDNLNKELFSDE